MIDSEDILAAAFAIPCFVFFTGMVLILLALIGWPVWLVLWLVL